MLKNKIYIFTLIINLLTQIYLIFLHDIESVRYFSKLYSLLFFSITTNTLISILLYYVHLKIININRYLIFTISLVFSNLLIFLNTYDRDLSTKLNDFISFYVINSLFDFKWITSSLTDGNLIWAIAISVYLAVILFIYNYFTKSKVNYKVKIFIYSLNLYLIIMPFSFFFTHYAIVMGNYSYLFNILDYTNKTVAIYEKTNQIEQFDIKTIKYFPTLNSAVDYYKNPLFTQKNLTSKNKIDFYNQSIKIMEQIDWYGFSDIESIQYNDMTRFHHWMQVFNNHSLFGSNQKTTWFAEISPVFNTDTIKIQDTLRHSVLYIKESKNGGYYINFDFNRTMRDFHLLYFFNLVFIIFNLLYWIIVIWIIRIHKK